MRSEIGRRARHGNGVADAPRGDRTVRNFMRGWSEITGQSSNRAICLAFGSRFVDRLGEPPLGLVRSLNLLGTAEGQTLLPNTLAQIPSGAYA